MRCYKAMALNRHLQDWYYMPLSVYHFQRRNYGKALEIALRINMPDYYAT